MGYRAHITKCIRESTFFRHHVEGALDELRDKYRKALLYDEIVKNNEQPVEEKRLRELEKKEAKFDKIMNARRDAMDHSERLWLYRANLGNEIDRIIKEYEKGE